MTTPSPVEERMARIEGSFEQIDHRLGTMEQDLRMFREETSASFATIIARLDQTNARLDPMRGSTRSCTGCLVWWWPSSWRSWE